VVRVDRERRDPLSGAQAGQVMDHLTAAGAAVDAVIVADYGKGLLSQPVADGISRWAAANGKILTVDPHPHTSLSWHGATAVKPNRTEAFLAAGLAPSDPVEPVLADQPLIEAGERLLRQWNTGSLLVTLGEQGMLLLRRGAPAYHIPTRAQTVFDVSGAGDTAVAVFTLALSAGATPPEAAEIANCASGIVVGKLGTATVSAAELAAGLAQGDPSQV
jgi:D-beta-D-heptose 7-phosphate kinase/D-beta-D-heptose 1-phosphate adenosyltransferase